MFWVYADWSVAFVADVKPIWYGSVKHLVGDTMRFYMLTTPIDCSITAVYKPSPSPIPATIGVVKYALHKRRCFLFGRVYCTFGTCHGSRDIPLLVYVNLSFFGLFHSPIGASKGTPFHIMDLALFLFSCRNMCPMRLTGIHRLSSISSGPSLPNA